jgi:hypothetical protein
MTPLQQYVTELRDFLLVVRDAAGRPLQTERCTLAASAAEFWHEAQRLPGG